MVNFLANRRILALLTAFFFVTSIYFFSTRLSSTMAFIRQPIHEAETPSPSPSPSSSAAAAAAVSQKQQEEEAPTEKPHVEEPAVPKPAAHDEKPAAEKPKPKEKEKEKEKEIVVTLTPADDPMTYGTQHHPEMGGLKLQADLPEQHVPTLENKKRLIVIGDIHGMLAPLETLLQKLEFDEGRDHIISVGDMINKGPDSAGVVSLLMKYGASAVRGNHEDRILLALNEAAKNQKDPAPIPASRKGEVDILATGNSLSPEQIEWLAQLPAILTIEQLRIYIVHAGMVPGVEPEKQEPWAIMNMRTLIYPKEELRKKERQLRKRGSKQEKEEEEEEELYLQEMLADRYPAVPVETRQGEKWTKAWNRYQRFFVKEDRWTVIYGHDAKRGFREERYSFGLDSGCVKGGALTALVIEAGESNQNLWRQMVLQVRCKQSADGKEDDDDDDDE